MSLDQRTEKKCLNCDAVIYGRYCQECAQENVAPQQSLRHMLGHIFNDLSHFDSKLFVSMRMLLFKLGFLSGEYVIGKRLKYMDPVRMYMFISAVFFVLFLTVQQRHEVITAATHPRIVRFIDSVRASNPVTTTDMVTARVDNHNIYVHLWRSDYRKGEAYYDSLQKALPKGKRSGFFRRMADKRMIAAYEAYDKDPYNANTRLWNNIYLSVSKLFFISLPLFALFLFLMYYKRRKELYFTSHVIFALHYYTIAWFSLLVCILVARLLAPLAFSRGLLIFIFICGMSLYLYVAMRRFYKQGKLATFFKAMTLLALTGLLLIAQVYVIWFMSYGFF